MSLLVRVNKENKYLINLNCTSFEHFVVLFENIYELYYRQNMAQICVYSGLLQDRVKKSFPSIAREKIIQRPDHSFITDSPSGMYTLVLHSDFVFRVCTDSWLHVVLLTDHTSNRLGDRFNFQVQFSSSDLILQLCPVPRKGSISRTRIHTIEKVILFYVHTYVLMHVQHIYVASLLPSVILGTKPSFLVDRSWIVLDWESSDTYVHTHTFQLSP